MVVVLLLLQTWSDLWNNVGKANCGMKARFAGFPLVGIRAGAR